MARKNIIGVLGIAAGIYYLATKLKSSEKILVNVVGLDLKLTNPAVKIEVVNPTNSNFSFKSFLGNIIVNGNDAGTIDYRKDTLIGPNSRQVINFPIRLKLLGAGGLLLDIIKGRLKGKIEINIKGTLNAEGFIINVDELYQYGK